MLAHKSCFACGSENNRGLGLKFFPHANGGVTAECTLDETFQGYPGVLQGGIVSTLLDSAMTNCLFQQNIKAMTAELNIRYHQPVLVNRRLLIEATMQNRRGRLYELNAVIKQQDKIKASAKAKFLKSDPAQIKGDVKNA